MIRSHYAKSIEQSLESIPHDSGVEGLELGIRSPEVSQMSQGVEWERHEGITDITLAIESPGLHRLVGLRFSREEADDELELHFWRQDVTFWPWKEGSEKEKRTIRYDGLASAISLRGIRKIAQATQRAAAMIERSRAIQGSAAQA